ncbi:MAG: PD40 domain-containing protein, partial [Candidatus Eisenbacteria bacterium]|nr:PD40 domain-containing protein [Candidatus Eisenbacteria bacterium]
MPDARTPHVDVHPAPFAILALALALARSRISLALALAVAGIPGADPAPSATVASTAEFPEVRVALADSGPERAPGALPAIVFVSRHADPARPAQIPGLGPHGCALITGGRLMLRDPDGRVRPLLIGDSMFDVSHPSISPDASRLAFAATRSAAGPWRIYVAGIDGGGLHAVTSGAASFDDLEPCWIDSRTLCFASTRYRQSDEYAGLPVPNLFTLDLVTGTLARLTSERNGAEAPSMDARRGTLLFSRWWFNRYRSARRGATGITLDPRAALPGDSVNLWQPMEMSAPSGRLRLAFGYPVVRLQAMGAQPVALANGGFAAVYARNMGLSPAPGGTGIWIFRSRYAPPTRLAGAAVPETATDPYSEATGLASPSACAPAALPDGRIVFALDPGARGDFGLWVSDANGDSLEPLVDLPGTLELDPAPVVAFD